MVTKQKCVRYHTKQNVILFITKHVLCPTTTNQTDCTLMVIRRDTKSQVTNIAKVQGDIERNNSTLATVKENEEYIDTKVVIVQEYEYT